MFKHLDEQLPVDKLIWLKLVWNVTATHFNASSRNWSKHAEPTSDGVASGAKSRWTATASISLFARRNEIRRMDSFPTGRGKSGTNRFATTSFPPRRTCFHTEASTDEVISFN